ncbi:hypothetical protein [Thorsellia anophelis]|uniref:Transposase n=1 Tax=Thorsellia anophelis DSM 18579 TaxID=1123402 RepID=A0A1I0FMW4_9GAMM|nr:hypothetical protein [Thorsellia anophelis]SET59479.1 hypothetical protein SAMN02583745_02822 [Thorsellia anophelis DSM 18579]
MSKFTLEFKETILTKLLDGDYTSITALAHYNISKSCSDTIFCRTYLDVINAHTNHRLHFYLLRYIGKLFYDAI